MVAQRLNSTVVFFEVPGHEDNCQNCLWKIGNNLTRLYNCRDLDEYQVFADGFPHRKGVGRRRNRMRETGEGEA